MKATPTRHSDHIRRLEIIIAATTEVSYRGISLGSALKVPFQDFLRFELDNQGSRYGRLCFAARTLRALAVRFLRGIFHESLPLRFPGLPLQVVAISDHAGHSTQLLLDSLASFSKDEVLFLSASANAMRQLEQNARSFVDVRGGLLAHKLKRLPLYWRQHAALIRPLGLGGLLFKLHTFAALCAVLDAIDLYVEAFAFSGQVVVLTSADGHWHEFVATTAAKARGLRTFTGQHGELTDVVDYVPLAADAVFAWGDKSRAQFERHGVPAGSIIVSGNPKFDKVFGDLIPRRESLRRGLLERLGLHADRPTMTYLSSGVFSTVEMDHARCRALFQCFARAAALPANLIVKLHPHQDDVRTYQAWRAAVPNGNRIVILQAEDVLDILTATDVAVGYHSTTCMEALGFGVPLLLLDIFPDVELDRYLTFCSDALRCRSESEYLDAVSPLIRDPRRLEAARNAALRCRARYFANSSGRPAAERIREALCASTGTAVNSELPRKEAE